MVTERVQMSDWFKLDRRFDRWLLLIWGLAIVTHFAVYIAFYSRWRWQHGLIHDEWDSFGINWVETGSIGVVPGVPSIHRGPGFVVVTALLYLVFGRNYAAWSISLLVFNTLTCVLVAWLARSQWGDRVGVLVGLFCAVHVPVIYYSAQIEQFTVVLPLVFAWCFLLSKAMTEPDRPWLPWVIGAVSGLLVLNKSVYLFFPLIAALFVSQFGASTAPFRTRLVRAGAVILVAGALIAPWTVRNYEVTNGKIVLVQTLLWTNVMADIHWDDLDAEKGTRRPSGALGDYLQARERALVEAGQPGSEVLNGPELELHHEHTFSVAGWKWFYENPGRNVLRVWKNTWQFWFGAENFTKTVQFALLQLPFIALALWGLLVLARNGRAYQATFAVIPVVVVWGEYSLVYAMGRFSLDFVPLLALMFALGADRWLSSRAGRSALSPDG